MPQYKLMYFNATGRGEAIRMLFALKGQEFEDYRFKEGEWAEIKGNADLFPLGQVPVLLIDGKAMPHSRAISQHLSREFGLYGANNAEAARIDVIGETVTDITSKLIPILMEKDDAKKAELVANFRDTASKPFMTYLNNAIKKSGGKFFIGSSETLADVSVYSIIDFVYKITGDDFVKGAYPELGKFHEGITKDSKLSAYLKSRPKS